MLTISQLRMGVDHSEEALKSAVAKTLKVPESAIRQLAIDQRAIDARRGFVEFTYTVLVEVDREAEVLVCCQDKRVAVAPGETYRELETQIPVSEASPRQRVIIIGTGPCGLICGLLLARFGWKPLLL